MLERALDKGVKAAWVTGDSVYSPAALRRALETRRQPFVLATAASSLLRFVEGDHIRQAPVSELFAELKAQVWQRLSAGTGSKGEWVFDWAWINLRSLGSSQSQASRLPNTSDTSDASDTSDTSDTSGFDRWMLARRSIEKPGGLAYYRVFAPVGTTLEEVVRAAGARWNIEVGFEQAKNEAGLDEYEVRTWVGWCRHVTLSLLAHALLTVLRAQHKKGGLEKRN